MAALYKKSKKVTETLSDYDRSLAVYLTSFKEKDYCKILEVDNRYEIFYHLSSMRKGILNWYPFEKNSSLLEIGGEYGALTGLFCERCSRVVVMEGSRHKAECLAKRFADKDNLEIYEGTPADINFSEKFDYIVWIGGMERCLAGKTNRAEYAEYIKMLIRFLKPDGRMIIGAENRYGLRYFCGDRDLHTGKSFDGINGYPEGSPGYSFSAKELDSILDTAGFTMRKFYYPMPDYNFPQMIYSQDYLPQRGLGERLRPFYYDKGGVVISENVLYDVLIENDVFPFFANSFLVECLNNGTPCDVNYSAVTSDRTRKHACITNICSDGTVRKSACFSEGTENIAGAYRNLEELKNQGIQVADHWMEKKALVMPFIKGSLLSIWLREHLAEGPEIVEDMFQKLFELILQSSEHATDGQNALMKEETSSLAWGPILKRTYIEMIPLNCFMVEGQYVFFDQEFVRENYPAKYVLFRALRNTYSFIPELEIILPLQRMKDKYELSDLWDILLSEDDKFLNEIRDIQGCRYYYQWLEYGRAYVKKYKTGYIAGVFDLFHVGHLNLINKAKERCENLTVGVLTDELVVHFKKKLPCIPFEERMAVVEAIKGVDRVVAVTAANVGKMESWNLYHYDCQFSGSDYENAHDWLEDKKRLEEVGSTIEFLPYTKTTNSTRINNIIKGRLEGLSLIVFGAGELGRCFLHWYQEHNLEGKWNLLGFLDNNTQKHYTLLERCIIYPPDYLTTIENHQDITVVIATKYKEEIKAQLNTMGIKNIISDIEFQAMNEELHDLYQT